MKAGLNRSSVLRSPIGEPGKVSRASMDNEYWCVTGWHVPNRIVIGRHAALDKVRAILGVDGFIDDACKRLVDGFETRVGDYAEWSAPNAEVQMIRYMGPTDPGF